MRYNKRSFQKVSPAGRYSIKDNLSQHLVYRPARDGDCTLDGMPIENKYWVLMRYRDITWKDRDGVDIELDEQGRPTDFSKIDFARSYQGVPLYPITAHDLSNQVYGEWRLRTQTPGVRYALADGRRVRQRFQIYWHMPIYTIKEGILYRADDYYYPGSAYEGAGWYLSVRPSNLHRLSAMKAYWGLFERTYREWSRKIHTYDGQSNPLAITAFERALADDIGDNTAEVNLFVQEIVQNIKSAERSVPNSYKLMSLPYQFVRWQVHKGIQGLRWVHWYFHHNRIRTRERIPKFEQAAIKDVRAQSFSSIKDARRYAKDLYQPQIECRWIGIGRNRLGHYQVVASHDRPRSHASIRNRLSFRTPPDEFPAHLKIVSEWSRHLIRNPLTMEGWINHPG